MSSSAASLCGCVDTDVGGILRLSATDPPVRPSYLQSKRTPAYPTDALTETVSSALARLGPVLVIRGAGDKPTHDPYGQCHIVRVIASSRAGDAQVDAPGINSSLLSCKLPYVERLVYMDFSALKNDHKIDFTSFITMYETTLREVRLMCRSIVADELTRESGYGHIFQSLRFLDHLERLTFVVKSNLLPPAALWTRFFANVLP